MEWFQKAIETGAFEEQTQPVTDDSESDNSESISNLSSHDLQSYSGANAGPLQLHFPSETSPTSSPVSAAISQSSAETHKSEPMQGRPVDPPKPNKHSVIRVRPRRSRLLSAVAFVLRYDRSFYDACLLGDYASAKKLLEQGANINAIPSSYNALGRAAGDRDQKMAVWLLSNGADPNVHAKYGRTPLYCAVEKGQTDLVALLLEHGADIEAGDTFSAHLKIAASHGHTDIVRHLLAHGEKVKPTTYKFGVYYPLLYEALKAGHDEIAQLLIESRFLNPIDRALRGPGLLAAVKGSCLRSLEMLLERADLNLEAKDIQGLTALDNAVQKEDLSMACFLLSRGAINNQYYFENFSEGYRNRELWASITNGYRRLADLVEEDEEEAI
jgi:ankyrin repeat protein